MLDKNNEKTYPDLFLEGDNVGNGKRTHPIILPVNCTNLKICFGWYQNMHKVICGYCLGPKKPVGFSPNNVIVRFEPLVDEYKSRCD